MAATYGYKAELASISAYGFASTTAIHYFNIDPGARNYAFNVRVGNKSGTGTFEVNLEHAAESSAQSNWRHLHKATTISAASIVETAYSTIANQVPLLPYGRITLECRGGHASGFSLSTVAAQFLADKF